MSRTLQFTKRFLLLLGLLLLASACTAEEPTRTAQDAAVASTTTTTSDSQAVVQTAAGNLSASTARPAGWAEESHSNDVDPNYEVVYPQDKVNQITITITPEDWAAMQANMTELYGEAGTGGEGGFGGRMPPPAGGGMGEPPAGMGRPPIGEGGFPPPAGGGMGGGGDFAAENPMWVAATIEFEGNTWTNVGVRYKGNSSLMSGWRNGEDKLPFKLDFDEFEDIYPEINNQRFYGFQQLSLANGFGDAAYMRDALTYDLLEEAGLVAAETAYYEVSLDYGEGPVNLGLYVAIEVIDDTVVERHFGDDSGNIYEGDGQAVTLAEGTAEQLADSFPKENNKDEADWSDLEALYNALHSDQRTSNPEAWRTELEAVFDVDGFLHWLALSATLQHWDTYGSMTHNFYLYNNPETGQLTWISWDHNLVLGGLGGGPNEQNEAQGQPAVVDGRGGPGGRQNVSFDKAEVGENWPLIRYLLDDPVYNALYVDYLEETSTLFDPEALAEKYQTWAAVIEPYAAEEDGGEAFAAAVQALTERTYAQAEALATFLATQP